MSGYSHLAGFVFFLAGTVALAIKAQGGLQMFAFLVFGISAVLLYGASAWYHLFGSSPEKIGLMRKLDHAFIYLLIAGTFTPFCLVLTNGFWRLALFVLIWAIAGVGTIGIFFRSFWNFFPRWAYTGLYLAMGWLGVTLAYPLRRYHAVLALLLAGGIFYSIGAAIYTLKRPNLSKKFGFHELFHCFVLAGTISHFYCIYHYVAQGQMQ